MNPNQDPTAAVPSPSPLALSRAADGLPRDAGGDATASRPLAALGLRMWREARPLFLACVLGMLVFMCFFVWLSGQIKLDAVRGILNWLPPTIQKLIGIPIELVATRRGQLAMAYIDPAVLFLAGLWAIARGTDCVSGEIGRGTMELVLAQPLRRGTVFWTHNGLTLLGSAAIAAAAWLGMALGILLVETGEHPDAVATAYVPAAVNLFSLMVFLGGASALASSADRYRWRSIGIMGGLFLLAMVVEMASRTVPKLEWLFYCMFLGPYEPHLLVTMPAEGWWRHWVYNAYLLVGGGLCYGLATWIFCRRDVPAPV